MNTEQYMKWVMELCNQEYQGSMMQTMGAIHEIESTQGGK